MKLFTIFSTLIKAPVPTEEKQSYSMMLSPPCFTIGMMFFWWWEVFGFCHSFVAELWPKTSSDNDTFSHSFWDFKLVFFSCKFSWALMVLFFFVNKHFHHATLPYSPDIWRIWKIFVTHTTQPLLVKNSRSSFNAAVGLLATSLTSLLLVFSSILVGHPILGNVTVVIFSQLDDDCLLCVPW